MDIEKIARKLEPLMPDKIQHLLRVRDMANADLRELIDKQILSIAYKIFSDYRSKIILSLPPENIAKGTIQLGNILYEKDKWPLGISGGELLQNMAIFGRSGAGKTNVAFHILEQLVDKKIPFLFLDWKRTARHLIPNMRNKINVYTPGRSVSTFPFNPFIVPPGLEARVYVNHIVDIMAEAFTLGDGAIRILQKAIMECYNQENHAPTATDILQKVLMIPDKERVRGWKTTVIRALESIEFANITTNSIEAQKDFVNKLSLQNTVVELDALSQNSKKFLVPALCLWLYYMKLSSPLREKLSLAIFIEEAHHVLYRQEQRSKESIMNMLLRQCREMGMCMIVIDQHPHLISSAALGNTYTSICLNLKDPTDINKAAGLSQVNEDDKKYFSMLPVGQGIVKLQDRWRKPILVQFPFVRVQKGCVNDEMLARHSTGSGFTRADEEKFSEVRQVRVADSILEGDALAFLQDVVEHEDDGVKARYARLGWSVDRGNRLKGLLIDRGWLDDQVIPVGKSRKVLLRLSRKGREGLGIDGIHNARESLAHEYWKRAWARKMELEGWDVTLEASRHGGRVDVLAVKDDERIGIEVETGKSDVVDNVRNCLLSKFDRVVVVATDKSALQKVERVLARARLIIPKRVQILIGDGEN